MASSSVRSPGTAVEDTSIGTDEWDNESYALAEGGGYSRGDVNRGHISHYIKFTDFGFNLPYGATINGIKVELNQCSSVDDPLILDYSIRLVKGGVIQGTDKSEGAAWNVYDDGFSYRAIGSSLELWGLSWTSDDINSSDFGVVIAIEYPSGTYSYENAYLDAVKITVYYTPTIDISFSDSITISEVISSNLTFQKIFSENISTSDLFNLQGDINLSFNETSNLSDEFYYLGNFNISALETSNLSDEFSMQSILNLSFGEEQIIYDEFSMQSILNIPLIDNVLLLDEVNTYKTISIEINFSEDIVLSEMINTEVYNIYREESINLIGDFTIELEFNRRPKIRMKMMNHGKFRESKIGRMIK